MGCTTCFCPDTTLQFDQANCRLLWSNTCNGFSAMLYKHNGSTWAAITGAVSPYTIPSGGNGLYRLALTSSNCAAKFSGSIDATCQTCSSQISGVSDICQGQSSLFSATGGQNYLWSTRDTTPVINVSPTQTTTYTVQVTTSDRCVSSAQKVVTVHPRPVAELSVSQPNCIGTSTLLSATGGKYYLWNTGATTQTISVNPASTTSIYCYCE